MPDNYVYTVEIDGTEYDIESDHEPTEAEVRALIGASDSPQPPTEAERQANMAAQAHVNTDPTTAAVDGFLASVPESVARLGIGAAKGVAKGALAIVDPRTYINTAQAVGDAVFPTSPEAITRTGERVKDAIKGVVGAVGDPDKTGDLIGQTAVGMAVPKIAPMVPGGMIRTGGVVEKIGRSPAAHRAGELAAVGVGLKTQSIPGAILAGATPYIVEGAGTAMRKAGELLKGKPATPPVRINRYGEPGFQPLEQPPVIPTPKDPVMPVPAPVRAATPAPASPIESQALQTQAPTGSDILNSPIAQQLLASLEERGATPGKVDVAEIPKSRSSGIQGEGSAPSATPGLTRNDMMAAGLNPDVRITKLTPEMRDRILQSRAARRSTYAEEAAMRRRLDALVDKDK